MLKHTTPALRATGLRVVVAAAAALGAAAAATSAHAGGVSVGIDIGLPILTSAYGPVGAISVRGGHRGGYYRRGGWGWGVGGVVLASPYPYYPYSPYYWGAPVVVTQPATVVEAPPPQAAPAPSRPDPVIYPRNGQSAQQQETDRQECNRWATTQAGALTDSTIFMRAVDACMDGRGYTTK